MYNKKLAKEKQVAAAHETRPIQPTENYSAQSTQPSATV